MGEYCFGTFAMNETCWPLKCATKISADQLTLRPPLPMVGRRRKHNSREYTWTVFYIKIMKDSLGSFSCIAELVQLGADHKNNGVEFEKTNLMVQWALLGIVLAYDQVWIAYRPTVFVGIWRMGVEDHS